MAKIKRSKVKIGKNRIARKKKQVIRVSIPEEPTATPKGIKNISILLHGEKKIGKTSLFAQEKGAFFLEFDPLQPFKIRQRHIPDWPHFIAYLDLVEKNPETVETLILDGVDIAYQLCFDWCCLKLVISHPHEEKDYGQSWRFIRTEFEKAMLRVLSLDGIAARFIAHSKWAEVESHSGGEIERMVPYLTAQADEVLAGRCDAWFAYVYDGKKHILVVKGDETVAAGHRVDDQFRTPDGEQIEEIDMGDNPKEAYQNLMTAFDNEQTYVKADDIEFTKKSKKKKKKKVKIRRK